MNKTIKQLIDSIPERLGFDPELKTPEEAKEFLLDEDFPIFFKAGNCGSFEDWSNSDDYSFILKCGYKSMYTVQKLFVGNANLSVEECELYNIGISNRPVIEYVYDGDIECDPTDDLSFFEDEGLDFIASIPKGDYDFSAFLNTICKICSKNNEPAYLDCYQKYSIVEKNPGFSISSEGKADFNGCVTICDDNGCDFAGSLGMFLMTFSCKTFQEIENLGVKYEIRESEQKIKIDPQCGMIYARIHCDELRNCTDVEKAINIVKKHPIVYISLPQKIQCNEQVSVAFIKSNSEYIREYNKKKTDWQIGCHEMLIGKAFRSEVAYFQTNGVFESGEFHQIPLEDNVFAFWYENENIVGELLIGEMSSWIRLSDYGFQNFNHKKLLQLSANYIILLKNYYYNLIQSEDGKKIKEHILRRYEMNDKSNTDSIAIMATFDMLTNIYPEYIPRLSMLLNNQILIEYIKPVLMNLPLSVRDEYLKNNMHLIYAIRNELSNDDSIVDYLCEYCPHAGDFLSDEIVLKRDLKRTSSDIDQICENCENRL